MSGNTFGQLFRLTTFGESHGDFIGGVIDGCPAGLVLDTDFVQSELDRRKPGISVFGSQRQEGDIVQFLSGLLNGKTTGAPIAFIIPNKDKKVEDYHNLHDVYRPSHADYSWQAKYGIHDRQGGGRASARETASRVVGGAIAKILLKPLGVDIIAYTAGVGEIAEGNYILNITDVQRNSSPVCCPIPELSKKMEELILSVQTAGDSIGSCVHCIIRKLPAGLGEPVFDKLDTQLAKAMIGIPAVKAVEIGSGVNASRMLASIHNDTFTMVDGVPRTLTNNSGGIQGGISNGEEILMKLHFKPPPSIAKTQKTIDIRGNEKEIEIHGRHDPCLAPRAIVIVEAMAAMVILDAWMINKNAKLRSES